MEEKYNDIIVNVHIELSDSNGNLKEERFVHNLVVASGQEWIADQLSEAVDDPMSHMAVGTDDTAATCDDTLLVSETDRVALTSISQGGVGHENEVIYVGNFGAGVGTGALTEAGIFNDDTAGDMLCRATYAVVNKGADDTLKITWTLTFGTCPM
jgi:hypothetical protein